MNRVVNWFVNSKCNLPCEYCFREKGLEEKSTEDMLRLVDVLAENDVRRVTIGGGEPLLRTDLETILSALKQKGMFVSLHTNGTVLRPRIEGIAPLVDILSLPIDSVNDDENKVMRGRPYVKLIEDIIKYASPHGVKFAFKTTASKANVQGVPGIYDIIKGTDFEYWKVYQFRPLNDAQSCNDKFCLDDGTFAALRSRLDAFGDARIHLIDRKQGHQPYLFLDNEGNVTTVDPIREQNIGVGSCYEIALARMGEYVQVLHGLAADLPQAERVMGRIDNVRQVVEAETKVDEAVMFFERQAKAALPSEVGGLLKAMAGIAAGQVKVRIISSRDQNDPRLAYYSDD